MVSVSCSCLPSFFHLFSCTVCFTDLEQGSEIISKFILPKSMKHTVEGVIIIKYSNSAYSLNISCEVNTFRGVNLTTYRNNNQRVSSQFQVNFFQILHISVPVFGFRSMSSFNRLKDEKSPYLLQVKH